MVTLLKSMQAMNKSLKKKGNAKKVTDSWTDVLVSGCTADAVAPCMRARVNFAQFWNCLLESCVDKAVELLNASQWVVALPSSDQQILQRKLADDLITEFMQAKFSSASEACSSLSEFLTSVLSQDIIDGQLRVDITFAKTLVDFQKHTPVELCEVVSELEVLTQKYQMIKTLCNISPWEEVVAQAKAMVAEHKKTAQGARAMNQLLDESAAWSFKDQCLNDAARFVRKVLDAAREGGGPANRSVRDFVENIAGTFMSALAGACLQSTVAWVAKLNDLCWSDNGTKLNVNKAFVDMATAYEAENAGLNGVVELCSTFDALLVQAGLEANKQQRTQLLNAQRWMFLIASVVELSQKLGESGSTPQSSQVKVAQVCKALRDFPLADHDDVFYKAVVTWLQPTTALSMDGIKQEFFNNVFLLKHFQDLLR